MEGRKRGGREDRARGEMDGKHVIYAAKQKQSIVVNLEDHWVAHG